MAGITHAVAFGLGTAVFALLVLCVVYQFGIMQTEARLGNGVGIALLLVAVAAIAGFLVGLARHER